MCTRIRNEQRPVRTVVVPVRVVVPPRHTSSMGMHFLLCVERQFVVPMDDHFDCMSRRGTSNKNTIVSVTLEQFLLLPLMMAAVAAADGGTVVDGRQDIQQRPKLHIRQGISDEEESVNAESFRHGTKSLDG